MISYKMYLEHSWHRKFEILLCSYKRNFIVSQEILENVEVFFERRKSKSTKEAETTKLWSWATRGNTVFSIIQIYFNTIVSREFG